MSRTPPPKMSQSCKIQLDDCITLSFVYEKNKHHIITLAKTYKSHYYTCSAIIPKCDIIIATNIRSIVT